MQTSAPAAYSDQGFLKKILFECVRIMESIIGLRLEKGNLRQVFRLFWFLAKYMTNEPRHGKTSLRVSDQVQQKAAVQQQRIAGVLKFLI